MAWLDSAIGNEVSQSILMTGVMQVENKPY
jgi:hypothetical protein